MLSQFLFRSLEFHRFHILIQRFRVWSHHHLVEDLELDKVRATEAAAERLAKRTSVSQGPTAPFIATTPRRSHP